MDKRGSILVVDDNKGILSALDILLPKYFKNVKLLSSPNTLISTINADFFDILLLDMNFVAGINTGNEGLYWLTEVKKIAPYIEVVLFTAYADIDLAVNAIKNGAFDFVSKPFDNAKLISTLMAAYQLGQSKRENKKLKDQKKESSKGSAEMYWGNSPKMKEIRSIVEKVAKTDATILITGENGTGKDVFAHEIHRLSKRSEETLVSVDIGSLPESLFESELFGHVKGAFTDAKSDRAGKFEAADRGTLFLDEIGNIPMHLQSKLLRAIQSKSVMRVGSNNSLSVDIRLISATNRDLEDMVRKEEFREDLLYRLNTIHIELPPLRERREDIVPFAEKFLEKYARKYKGVVMHFESDAQKALNEYNWSGNIRELQHTVEKAVILSEGGVIRESDLLLSPILNSTDSSKKDSSLSTLDDMEKKMIKDALDKFSGNLSQVAQQLGITRQTLYNKIKKYSL